MNHTILHIGAGEGQDVELQLAGKPKRLILVEPNPDIAARLREKLRGLNNVELHEVAVIASAKEEQIATLHEYNWNNASSLQEATQLEQLFPGLRLVRNHHVKALSPVALIERLDLDREEEHVLTIETPAAEKGIINALCDSGQIGLFSELTLSCPGANADGTDPTDLLTRLADYGFEPVEQDENDPDWPVFVLKRNRWRYELLRAEKGLKTLDVRLRELQEEKRTLGQVLAECQAQVEKLTEARVSETKLRAELEGKLDQATKSRDEQARLASERHGRVLELESQLADLEQRQALMVEEMHRAEGQIDLITDVLLKEPGL